ncbi:MAG: biopolymer transporter ExbD [Gammaproteobacteria bacterium]|nr:biopolymer transporter ExbD [Gammaproteobacteria bacterium]
MRLRRAIRDDEPEINLISLIDVLLVLLIFFMISTTFQREARLRVELPRATDVPDSTAREPLVITITAAGDYLVNGRALANGNPATLQAALERAAGKERGPLTIRADARTTHQSVVTAMDVAGRLGFTRLDIATTHEAGAQ